MYPTTYLGMIHVFVIPHISIGHIPGFGYNLGLKRTVPVLINEQNGVNYSNMNKIHKEETHTRCACLLDVHSVLGVHIIRDVGLAWMWRRHRDVGEVECNAITVRGRPFIMKLTDGG